MKTWQKVALAVVVPGGLVVLAAYWLLKKYEKQFGQW